VRRLAIAALLLLPAAAQAQTAPRIDTVPALVRHGKWVGAAAFAGVITMAVVQHNSANRAWDRLVEYCNTANCALAPDGRYQDAGAEAHYQNVVRGDRAARVWLIAGQVTLVGTAALFVLELTRERGTTNIPFSGLLVEPGRVGWRLSF
jgi:hypothetical protein